MSGPEKDVHSGNDGGVFTQPMQDLLTLLASLQSSNCELQVAGLGENVRPGLINMAWSSLQDSREFTLEGYREALSVPALTLFPGT